jgi:hypothetical protein
MNTDKLNEELKNLAVLPDVDFTHVKGNTSYDLDIDPKADTAKLEVKVKL